MFDITNKELIMKLVSMKDDDIVIPLYVRTDIDRYSILELDDIISYSPSSFKVGFGTVSGLFVKNGFDNRRAFDFDVINVFNHYNEETMSESKYTIFESGYITDGEINDTLNFQINFYIDILEEYVRKHVDEVRRELIRKQMEENS